MHYGHFYEDGHHQFVRRAGHGTRGIGFKYGKMKGLKISPPQSVARIDHTSFLCANEASSVSFCLPIHHPLSVLPSLSPSAIPPHPSPSPCFPVHLPLRASQAGSRNMPFFKQPVRRARCTCVLSRRFASRSGNVAFTRFSWKLC